MTRIRTVVLVGLFSAKVRDHQRRWLSVRLGRPVLTAADAATGLHRVTKDPVGAEGPLGWLADTRQTAVTLGACANYFPRMVSAGQAASTAVFDTSDPKFLGATQEGLGFAPCKPGSRNEG